MFKKFITHVMVSGYNRILLKSRIGMENSPEDRAPVTQSTQHVIENTSTGNLLSEVYVHNRKDTCIRNL